MYGAMQTPDASDAQLRQLLDERSARADPLGRYSMYTDADDTPSVYSRAFFSPRPADKPHADASASPPTSHLRPRRLLDDPSSSVLDFGEDRSSMAFGEAYDTPDDTRDLDDDSDDSSLPRMSYLGPKMRFHSRAPWELEGESLQEVDETESTGHGSIMGMLRGKTPKTESSSSSRPSTAFSRPSVESSRSFLHSKRSFDTSHPRGAFYALAQESLSTSSLGRPHQSARQEGARGNFSLGRLRSLSSNVHIPSSPDRSVTRLPSNNHPPIASPSPRASCDTTSSTLDVQADFSTRYTSNRSDKGFHPYANPDLVVYSTEPPLPRSPIRSNLPYPDVPRKDSNSTVLDISASPTPAKSLTHSAPTSEVKRRVSHIQGKEISRPVNVLPPDSPIRPQFDEQSLSRPSGAAAIPGWTERNINPGFSLISLEEARAQRFRGAPVYSPLQSHESSSSGHSSVTTAFNNGTQETSTTLASAFSEANRPDVRSRARSISAGTKAKNTLTSFIRQPERRGSENGLVTGGQASAARDTNATAGKTLKHKKSGFMRLFGNGKVSEEKEPPPVPQPPSFPPLPQPEPTPTPTPRHNPKLSSHRIPVPSLSPSLLEAVAQQEAGESFTATPNRPGVGPKRSPPGPLSISTRSSPLQVSPRGHFSGAGLVNDDDSPQSAPPNVGDFPALKLRPVSSLFSAHFGDHIDVTKLTFDEPQSIGPKETVEDVTARQENDRQRQDSLASSGPSSSSATSFMESQYNLSPIAPSHSGTALTTPTTGGLMSPTSTTGPGPWNREREYSLSGTGSGGRFSVDHNSAPPSSTPTNPNLSASHVVREKDTADTSTTIRVLQEHLDNTNRMWEKKVLELEKELVAVKNELSELKAKNGDRKALCHNCGGGRGGNGTPPLPPLPPKSPHQQMRKFEGGGVMTRPRARTGGSSRFVNGTL